MSQAIVDPELFREKVRELRGLQPHDWRDWEFDWFDSQMRKPKTYVRSEKEQAKLAQLIDYGQGHAMYEGRSVGYWITVTYKYRFDLSEPEADFVEDLYNRRVSLLRHRQLRELMRILQQQDVIDAAA
jgi:hypothetical protein